MDAIMAVQNASPPAPKLEQISDSTERDDVDDHIADRRSSSYSSDGGSTGIKREKERATKRKKKKHKVKHKHKKVKSCHRSESPVDVHVKDLPKIPVGSVFLDDIHGLKPEHAYRIDRKKNKDLWHYKSISSRHIAKYKTFFSHSCLGAPHLRFDKKISDKKEKSQGISRYYGKVGARQIRCKGTELFSNSNAKESSWASSAADPNFIALPKSISEKDSVSENRGSYSCLDEATSRYIHGKATDDSNNTDSTAWDQWDFVMDEIFEKTKTFNQRTREEQDNVALWLEFVAFQDVVAQREKAGSSSGSLSQSTRLREVYRPSKSVIEKKLSILEKALESNPSSLELKLAQLEMYQDIWETDKLEKAWEDLLFVHSGNVDLWREYLARQQCSRLHGFTVSRAVKQFHKCFQTLTSIMDGKVKVIQKAEDMEEKTISLFSQYCDFLHFSGYTERAVSTYQSLIEFNLFCPPNLNLASTTDRLAQFEEFWDSSVPRFGEIGGKGWATWAEQRAKGVNQRVSLPVVSTEEQEDAIVLEQLSRVQTWIKMEQLREKTHYLPWRPDTFRGETEDAAEDPESLVLFDDVAPLLFRLSKSESCLRIVCLFLKFLGLASPVLDERVWLLEQEAGSLLKFEQYSKASLYQVSELSRCYSTRDIPSRWVPEKQHLSLVTNVLTQAESYFSLSNRVFFTRLKLECEILKHGTRRISDISASNVKDIKRFGKGLLKESQNRNNLVLWNAYIRLLWACSDKIGEAVSMAETAMAMFMGSHNASDPEKRFGVSLLCLTYCQILLNFEPLEYIQISVRPSAPSLDDKHQAIACLGALIENKVFKPKTSKEITPAYILKVRSMFLKSMSELTSKTSVKDQLNVHCDFVTCLSDCFALLEFCASGLEGANSIYETTRLSIQKNEQSDSSLSRALQMRLYLSQLSFITNIMQISLSPRSVLRKVITEGLTDFPDCPRLHAAYIELEAGCHIAGRLRKFYDKSLRNTPSLTVALFAAASELARLAFVVEAGSSSGSFTATYTQDTGTVHRLRSVFEAALSHNVSNHCPLMWRLYLNFEFKYGAESRAKGILYRALQSCPWAKCIFMDGINLFGDAELQELMDLMTEEEIRVRIPLEEVDLLLTAEKEDSDQDNAVKEDSESESGEENPPENDSAS